MPSSPGGICLDCSSRAVSGSKYCDRHQTSNNKAQHKRLYDRQRANDPHRSLYRTKRWQGTRRIVFARDVLCVMCGHKAATECDHIINARLVVDQFGVDAFFDPQRCQGCCHDCHSQKTIGESGWAGRPKS